MPGVVPIFVQSPALQAAIASRDKRSYQTVDLLQGGQSIYRLIPVGTGDTWSCDETRSNGRRQCTLTLMDPTGALTPTSANTLLEPASVNEISVQVGYYLADGTTETNPVGLFRITQPKVHLAPEGVQITIGGNDRALAVSLARWDKPFPIQAGVGVSTAIRVALNDRLPGLNFAKIQQVKGTIPSGTVLGSTPTTDPWSEIDKLATDVGAELFFDAVGDPVLRPVIDPTAAPITATYTAGSGGTGIASAERDLDETKTYSGIVVISASVGTNKPAQATVWDEDPSSPTYVGKIGKRPVFLTSSAILDAGECYSVGLSQLNRIRRVAEVANVTLLSVNPGHEGGDGIWLNRDEGGLTGKYILSNFSGGLGPNLGGMNMVSRSTAYTALNTLGTLQ